MKINRNKLQSSLKKVILEALNNAEEELNERVNDESYAQLMADLDNTENFDKYELQTRVKNALQGLGGQPEKQEELRAKASALGLVSPRSHKERGKEYSQAPLPKHWASGYRN